MRKFVALFAALSAVLTLEVSPRAQEEILAQLERGPISLQIDSGASIVEYKDIEIESIPKTID